MQDFLKDYYGIAETDPDLRHPRLAARTAFLRDGMPPSQLTTSLPNDRSHGPERVFHARPGRLGPTDDSQLKAGRVRTAFLINLVCIMVRTPV